MISFFTKKRLILACALLFFSLSAYAILPLALAVPIASFFGVTTGLVDAFSLSFALHAALVAIFFNTSTSSPSSPGNEIHVRLDTSQPLITPTGWISPTQPPTSGDTPNAAISSTGVIPPPDSVYFELPQDSLSHPAVTYSSLQATASSVTSPFAPPPIYAGQLVNFSFSHCVEADRSCWYLAQYQRDPNAPYSPYPLVEISLPKFYGSYDSTTCAAGYKFSANIQNGRVDGCLLDNPSLVKKPSNTPCEIIVVNGGFTEDYSNPNCLNRVNGNTVTATRGNESVTATISNGQIEVKRTTDDVNTTTVDVADVSFSGLDPFGNLIGRASYVIAGTGIRAAAALVTAGGTVPPSTSNPNPLSIVFPTDYARAGESQTGANQISNQISNSLFPIADALTNTNGANPDPTDLTASDMPTFGGVFDQLKGWQLPAHTSTCPQPQMTLFGNTYTLSSHCALLQNNYQILHNSMIVVFSILALFIVLRA